MTIKNPVLVWIIVKMFNLKPYKVDFRYEKEILDSELTKLAFLNNVREEFNEQADIFNEELQAEIEKESKRRAI